MTDLHVEYRRQFTTGGRQSHHWFCKGPLGAVHTWATRNLDTIIEQFGEGYYGGIEYHYAKPPSYMGEEPSHERCWILDAPCWHDGSSLQFVEQILPHLSADGEFSKPVHQLIFYQCEKRYPNLGEDR